MAKDEESKSYLDANKPIVDMIGELQKETKLTGKESRTAWGKLVDSRKDLAGDVVAMGADITGLNRDEQKKIYQSLQQSGAEVTDREEQRGREMANWLVKFANQQKRLALEERKDNAEGAAKVGLTIQSGLLKGFHKVSEGWMAVKDAIHDNASIKNMGQALSQDLSLLTMEFQGLMQLPGMKTIVAGIKYIAAWAAKLILPLLQRFWAFTKRTFKKGWNKIRGKESVPPASAVPLRKDGEPDMRYAINKTKKDGLKGAADTADTAGLTPTAATEKGKDAVKEKAGASPKGLRSLNKTLKSIEKPLKKLVLAIRKFVRLMQTIFSAKVIKGLQVAALKNRKATGMFTKALRWLTKTFRKVAKAFMKVIKRFAIVIGQFLIQIGLFIVNMLVAIAGFIVANLPLIALIALVVLVAIGYYLLIKYIMDNWETIKVKMAMAMDRLKLVGTKIANWFKDLGADIGYRIKQLVAKIKDGLVWVINTALEAFAAMMPDGPLGKRAAAKIRAFKMEEGTASAKVDADRGAQLAAREVRDKQLEADFEAKYAERGKELEEAAKKDADRKAKKDAGPTQDIKTSTVVNTDNREVATTVESTESNDLAATQAMMLHG